MLIKVIKTQKAASCPMGVKTKVYEAKEEPQEIHDDLAKVFIKEGWGILANEPVNNSQEEEKVQEEVKEIKEEKAVEETENKAIKKSPKNKSFADNKNINNKKGK